MSNRPTVFKKRDNKVLTKKVAMDCDRQSGSSQSTKMGNANRINSFVAFVTILATALKTWVVWACTRDVTTQDVCRGKVVRVPETRKTHRPALYIVQGSFLP